ncbi:hypothetical protein BDW60DRAFT_64391 [Aspergillus nidulans var. acristatus]|jgi:curved DNA-binding protein CbpA
MTLLPDFDPYEALGISKDATLAEIKSSHRKLVLKCHPDKIKDESLRSEAQTQFQKVQQAYECLSDETTRAKYDNKVKLAELKREMAARGASYTRSNTREYRDGRIYEERVPADARSSSENFFEEEGRYTESPRPTSRKHAEYGARPRSRTTTDEKRRSSRAAPSSSATRAAKKEARNSEKASRADRDKVRTKERKRESHDKYIHIIDVDSDSDSSASSEVYYIPVKKPSDKRYRDAKTRPTESVPRSSRARYGDEDDYDSDDYKHDKVDVLSSRATDYIRRSKETIPEPDRRHRSSRSPHGYESGEHSGRSRRSTRPPTSHHSSYEHLDHAPRTVPSMPTAATFPGPQTSHHSRSSGHVRSESRTRRTEHIYFAEIRTSKLRGERSDSGYASSSPTPEIPEISPKASRYKTGPEPVLVEPRSQGPPPPPPLRHSRTYSPPRQDRPNILRSTTYTYPADSSQSSRRPLYRELDPVDARIKEREIRRSRDVQYIPSAHAARSSDYTRPVGSGRRTSAYA